MNKCKQSDNKALSVLFGLLFTGITSNAAAETFVADLSHIHGTYAPKDGDIGQPDMSKPHKGSVAVPVFGLQGVQERLPDYPTNNGPFIEGRFVVHEHFGTHVDAPAHVENNEATRESGNPDLRTAEELTAEDLYGPVVYLDISARVQAELDNNNGIPGPISVTDFSDESKVGITATDIEAIEDKIKEGVWIVVNTNWSKFFYEEDKKKSPYINNWNYPGFSAGACDKLIEIEDRKGIRIDGIVMDNMSVGSGDNGTGPKDDWIDAWHCHIRGIQRGWLLVENAANLGRLSNAKPGSCSLFVGALKIANAAGVPSRVIAVCESREHQQDYP